VLLEPLGPVAAITPWNFLIIIPARKLGATPAAGCPVVFKPAEETPASGFALAAAPVDPVLPPGGVSVVCGDPQHISEHLSKSPVIRRSQRAGSWRDRFARNPRAGVSVGDSDSDSEREAARDTARSFWADRGRGDRNSEGCAAY
jgi:hypothetical protein